MTILLTILSSCLLALAYPPFDLFYIPFFCLSLFFIPLLKVGPKKGGLLGILFGSIFFGLVLFWMNGMSLYGVMAWQRPILWASLTFTLSLYTGLFGLAAGFIAMRMKFISILSFPLLWCGVEFIRTHIPFGGFPWVLLGHSQYMNPAIIQISKFTGAYGVSFLLALLNAGIAQMISGPPPIERRIFFICIPSLLILGSWLYGSSILKTPLQDGRIKVSAVQGNFPIEMSWDWKDEKGKFHKRLTALTREAVLHSPSLIVWTETIILEPIGYLPSLRKDLSRLLGGKETLLLLGAPHPYLKRHYNSAFLISKDGRIVGRYDKIHLVPFGEYLPLERLFPWIRRLIPKGGDYISGTEFTIFDLDGVGFGVLICFEGIFPSLTRRFIQRGATFLVNITNDAWSRRRSSHLQHFQSAIFRAVENGCYIVRAGNTGVTAIIDPYGRVRESLPINTPGIIIGHINPLQEKTFYTRWGDLFCLSCLGGGFILILFALINVKKILFLHGNPKI